MLARRAPDEREAKLDLLVAAARHHGVGTAADLADYYRLVHTRDLFAELVADGRLVAASVRGWSRPAFVHPDAAVPRRVEARALLSPFDPVVWFRDRASRLFDFDYRIEIYTPKPKRRYGYYVLPFLLGDRLCARVDLKAERSRSVLIVQAAWYEPASPTPPDEVAAELAAELAEMADWLGLGHGVEVVDRGDLAGELGRAVNA